MVFKLWKVLKEPETKRQYTLFYKYVLEFPLTVAKSKDFSSHSVEVQLQSYKNLLRLARGYAKEHVDVV